MASGMRWGAAVATGLACWMAPLQADDRAGSFLERGRDGANCNVPAVCRSLFLEGAAETPGTALQSLAAHCNEREGSSAVQAHCNARYRRYRICALYEQKPELFKGSHCHPGLAEPQTLRQQTEQ